MPANKCSALLQGKGIYVDGLTALDVTRWEHVLDVLQVTAAAFAFRRCHRRLCAACHCLSPRLCCD